MSFNADVDDGGVDVPNTDGITRVPSFGGPPLVAPEPMQPTDQPPEQTDLTLMI